MAFTTTITRKNWEKKVAHTIEKGYFYEYKEQSEHWKKRIPPLEPPCSGVFLVGIKIHRVVVLEVEESKTQHIPEEAAKFVRTEECYILKCLIPVELKHGSTAVSSDGGFEIPQSAPIKGVIIPIKGR